MIDDKIDNNSLINQNSNISSDDFQDCNEEVILDPSVSYVIPKLGLTTEFEKIDNNQQNLQQSYLDHLNEEDHLEFKT